MNKGILGDGKNSLAIAILSLVILALIVYALSSCAPATSTPPNPQPTGVYIAPDIYRADDNENHIACYVNTRYGALSCVPITGR